MQGELEVCQREVGTLTGRLGDMSGPAKSAREGGEADPGQEHRAKGGK